MHGASRLAFLTALALAPGCVRFGFPEGDANLRADVGPELRLADRVSEGPGDGSPPKDGRPSGQDLREDLADARLADRPGSVDAPPPRDGWRPEAVLPDGPRPPDAPLADQARLEMGPQPDLGHPDKMAFPDLPSPDQGTGPLWWNTAYPSRLRLTLTNTQPTALVQEPFFVKVGANSISMRESSIRVVRWNGSVHTEVPFALHDWSAGLAQLGDSDGVVDADDELLLLIDLPAGGSAEYQIYFDVVDHPPAIYPAVKVSAAGAGFPRVAVDGVTADRSYLRFSDGAGSFDLMLTDSIPYWNQTSNYTYESSAIGPRINDLTLPSGLEVFSTVDHTSGIGTGKLTHTIRLGPFRVNGNFSLLSSSQAFYGARLVSSIAHSQVRAWSRPLAAVVVIDAELYCDEPGKCDPPRDVGDVRLVGYLFDRGNRDEVLMRWRVAAQMDGTSTISATTTTETEFYNLAAYLIESYCEAQFPSLIDLDTVRLREAGSGAVFSAQFDNSKGDIRTCKNTDSWILMSDTDSPLKGVIALLPEGNPLLGTSASTWRGCWWGDGGSGLELNGYQTEWHLSASAFGSWGSSASDSAAYSYWIYAYPRTTADDQSFANERALRIQTPPLISVKVESSF